MTVINMLLIMTSSIIFSNSDNSYGLFSIGCQLEFAGKIEEAIEYYELAKVLDPQAPEIYVSLAGAYYRIRKFRQGINYANQGLAIAPDHARLYLVAGLGYIGKGDLKQASEYYEKALPLERQNNDIYIATSILYESIGDLKKASQVLENMPENIKNAEAYTRLGSLAGRLNEHKVAIEYFQKSYIIDTTDVTPLIGIATAYDVLGAKDSAIYYFEKVLEQDTFNLTIAKRLVELYSDTEQYEKLITISREILMSDYNETYMRRNLAFALYKLGMTNEALGEFLIAAGIDPLDTYSRFYAGRIYLEQADYDAAQQEITEALKINPDFIELWIYLGFIAIDKKDFRTAEYAFVEAAHRGGDMQQVYYLLGVVADMQDDQGDAYYYHHKSLTIDSTYLANLESLANLCARMKREDEAFALFNRIIKVDTTNAIALNYVGYVHAERNDSLEYALGLIDKALAMEENNGYYIDSRGWVFYQMQRYEDALTELKRASELVEDPTILEHLGDVYMKLNEPIKAKDAYEKAFEIEPSNKTIKEKLLNLQAIEGNQGN